MSGACGQTTAERGVAALSQRQREDLLRSGWMYHDYLWFKHTLEQVGPEAVNEPNLAILHAMARAEMLRLMRALGVCAVRDTRTVLLLFRAAGELYVGGLVPMTVEAGADWIRLSTTQCFVHLGTQRDGLAGSYRCGPMTRASGWMAAMGLEWEFDPPIGLCLMSQGRGCRYTIHFRIPAERRDVF